MRESPDERGEAERVGREEVMNVGHFPGGEEQGFRKGVFFVADFVEEMFGEGVFLMGSDDDKFKSIEDVHSFPAEVDLHLQLVEQFVGRVVLHPQKRVSDVHQEESTDLAHNVVEQNVGLPTRQIDQS